jgi:NADPH2:quinone reductase
MRAAVVQDVGQPPRPAELPEPSAGDGQALVRVTAAPLNPVEIRVASGRFPRPPQTPYAPGAEGVGTVIQNGRLPAGTRVRFETPLPGFGANGGLAQVAAVYSESLVELPDAASDELSAAVGTVGITAWMALDRVRLRAGETVLVLGATGAVGQAAIQLAKLRGAGRVVAAGRDGDALARAAELGADATVNLEAVDDLTGAFRDAAGGDLDVVVDPLWGAPAVAAMQAIAVGGRIVNVGESAGGDVAPPLVQLRNQQAAIEFLSTGWMPLDAKRDAYRKVLAHALAGDLTVDLEVVPLDDVASAWERQAQSPGRKLVIAIDQPER